MTIKRLSSLMMFFGVVLFSYATANAQQTPSTPPPTTANPRVVITDPLAKPATPAEQPKPATSTTKFGSYSVNVIENVTGQNLENGKFFTVTKWDGTKWVTKREWIPNKKPATTPDQ